MPTASLVMLERTYRSGKKAGQKYFMVEDSGLVIASDNPDFVQSYIDTPELVELLPENNGWRWIREVHVPEGGMKASNFTTPTVVLQGTLNKQTELLINRQKLLDLRTKLSEFVTDVDGLLGL